MGEVRRTLGAWLAAAALAFGASPSAALAATPRPAAGPDAPDPGPDDVDAPAGNVSAPEPTEAPTEAPAEAAPVDAEDRAALARMGSELPRHGVPPLAAPAADADDAAWRAYGRKLVEVFAPRSLRTAKRERLVATDRPLNTAITKLIPTHRRYIALQQQLVTAAQRAVARPTPLRKAPYEVRVGGTAPEVAVLRDRLALEGYGDPNVVGRLREYFDPRLKRALWAWQRDHDLPLTVVIDPLTRERLNAPLADQVPRLALALARWRELDLRADSGAQVLVHVNAFALVAEEDGREVLTMPVIVGRATAADATPALSAKMVSVVARPDWRVPKRIVEEALRPRAEGVPEVLMDEGYEVEVTRGGEWRVRLPPGPDNPLGEVKFVLRGTDGVYLHDTNRRDLFKREARALSHGCVRVAAPRELAAWIVGARAGELAQAIEGTASQKFELAPAVPTHLVYQTTTVAADGRLVSHADLYGRDAEALAALDVATVAPALVALTEAAAAAEAAPAATPAVEDAVAPE